MKVRAEGGRAKLKYEVLTPAEAKGRADSNETEFRWEDHVPSEFGRTDESAKSAQFRGADAYLVGRLANQTRPAHLYHLPSQDGSGIVTNVRNINMMVLDPMGRS